MQYSKAQTFLATINAQLQPLWGAREWHYDNTGFGAISVAESREKLVEYERRISALCAEERRLFPFVQRWQAAEVEAYAEQAEAERLANRSALIRPPEVEELDF